MVMMLNIIQDGEKKNISFQYTEIKEVFTNKNTYLEEVCWDFILDKLNITDYDSVKIIDWQLK